jgi:hypothetical protein
LPTFMSTLRKEVCGLKGEANVEEKG